MLGSKARGEGEGGGDTEDVAGSCLHKRSFRLLGGEPNSIPGKEIRGSSTPIGRAVICCSAYEPGPTRDRGDHGRRCGTADGELPEVRQGRGVGLHVRSGPGRQPPRAVSALRTSIQIPDPGAGFAVPSDLQAKRSEARLPRAPSPRSRDASLLTAARAPVALVLQGPDPHFLGEETAVQNGGWLMARCWKCGRRYSTGIRMEAAQRYGMRGWNVRCPHCGAV